MSRSLYEIGDMVRIQLEHDDRDEPCPDGFVGLISGKTFMPSAVGPFDMGSWVYDVGLPIAWDEGERHYFWTFKETELLLLELAEDIQ